MKARHEVPRIHHGQSQRRTEDRERIGAFEIIEVTVNFGGLTALKSVSMSCEAGGVLGVIGPNGSGKSTLLNVASGFQNCESGTFVLDGRDLTSYGPSERARMGVARTFQAIRLFPSLSVMENILAGASGRRTTSRLGSVLRTPAARREGQLLEHEALDIARVFDDRLIPRINELALNLSYANRRRTELARSLISRPRLLLLDEPTAGMNPHETEEFAAQLEELARRSLFSVIIVEHKMNVISGLCDKVVVLNHGEKLVEGTPDEVQNSQLVTDAFLGGE